MIPNILCRLPVKSLLRFRCTTKDMCSTIDGPDFARLHLQTHSNQSLLLIDRHLYHLYLYSIDDLRSPQQRAVKIQHPLKTLQRSTEVFGCCNGLVCLANSRGDIVLWNISTRKHRQLPYAPIVLPDGAGGSHHRISTKDYGFGYDSVHDEYKLVRIVQFRGTSEKQVMVYGMKSNSWKRGNDFPSGFQIEGVLAGGALYWLTSPEDGGGGVVAVVFDLATEEFQVVPERLRGRGVVVTFGVWENRLCLFLIWAGKQVDMWAMKEEEDSWSWTKMLSTSDLELTSASKSIRLLAYLSNGDEVLILKDSRKLFRYDLKRNKLELVRVRGTRVSFKALLYVESLVEP